MWTRIMYSRKWRWAVVRLIYAGIIGTLVVFGTSRVGDTSRHKRSWASDLGDMDFNKYVSLSLKNVMAIKEYQEKYAREHDRNSSRDASSHKGYSRSGNNGMTKKEWLERNARKFRHFGKYLLEPIEPHDYRYIHIPRNICADEKGDAIRLELLVYVPSALEHVRRRDHIRVTYGSREAWEPFKHHILVRTVFMMGSTTNPVLQAKIDKEASIYGDIVQEDFIDSYRNLTRKTVMGLKWITQHCRHAQFAMKLDDDSMINKARILEFIMKAPYKGVAFGNVNLNTPVIRSKKGEWGKYHVSREFYPASTYPPYLSGPAYIMSTDVVEALYQTAITVPLFPWEDVFIGLCLQRMGVGLMHDRHFLCYLGKQECYRDSEWLKRTVFIDLSMEHMLRVWVQSSLYAEKLLSND